MADIKGRVLVLGASGETGQEVIKALQAKNIPARALVRTAEKGQSIQSDTTEVVIGEINNHNLLQVLSGVTAIISAIGTRELTNLRAIEAAEYKTIVDAIEAAKKAGIERFVLCSSMRTENPASIPPLANILHAKARAEEALIKSDLTYTIVHPGGLLNGPGGQNILITRHPTSAHGAISRVDTAEVLVQALLQAEAHNKSVDIIQQQGQGPANRPDLFSAIPSEGR